MTIIKTKIGATELYKATQRVEGKSITRFGFSMVDAITRCFEGCLAHALKLKK